MDGGMKELDILSFYDIYLFSLYDMIFQNLQKADVSISRLSFSLSSYLYFLVTKKSLRLQVGKFIICY